MRIEHIAVWTNNIEELKDFYSRYFNAVAGDKYFNREKKFQSYFLSFDNGARLEIMQMPGIPESKNDVLAQFSGLIHFAISTGSKEQVDAITEEIRAAGYKVIGEARWTGDGYYESVILDPDNNRIELTI